VPHKSYDQYCGIAAALDVVGDRWTLLVLRELSFGRLRFTDLRTALPGIASNLLAGRLRDLEDAGLVEQQELPAPAARTVYALTADGRRIGPVLAALAKFGLPLLDDPVDGGVRPRTAVHGVLAPLLDGVTAAGRDLTMRFDLDGEEHWLRVRDGRLERADRAAQPDLVLTGSAAALVEQFPEAQAGAVQHTVEMFRRQAVHRAQRGLVLLQHEETPQQHAIAFPRQLAHQLVDHRGQLRQFEVVRRPQALVDHELDAVVVGIGALAHLLAQLAGREIDRGLAQEAADAVRIVDAVVAHAPDDDDKGFLGEIVHLVRLQTLLLQHQRHGAFVAPHARRLRLPVAAGDAGGKVGIAGGWWYGHRI